MCGSYEARDLHLWVPREPVESWRREVPFPPDMTARDQLMPAVIAHLLQVLLWLPKRVDCSRWVRLGGKRSPVWVDSGTR